MCQVALISKNVVRVSKRTYSHWLEVATPDLYRVGQLAGLNRDLDKLYELVYGQWRTITEDDYRMIGGQFKVLLQTIKDLHTACLKVPKEKGLTEEARKLAMNYSALRELDSDIESFGIRAPKDRELKDSLAKAGELCDYSL